MPFVEDTLTVAVDPDGKDVTVAVAFVITPMASAAVWAASAAFLAATD